MGGTMIHLLLLICVQGEPECFGALDQHSPFETKDECIERGRQMTPAMQMQAAITQRQIGRDVRFGVFCGTENDLRPLAPSLFPDQAV